MCSTFTRAGQPETLEEWSDIIGASSRTLARLFASVTGMRFVDWRHQARLADILVRLARGQDVAFGNDSYESQELAPRCGLE